MTKNESSTCGNSVVVTKILTAVSFNCNGLWRAKKNQGEGGGKEFRIPNSKSLLPRKGKM
jgi:hypothetical protein